MMEPFLRTINKYDTFAQLIAALSAYGEAPAITVYDRRGRETTVSYAQLQKRVYAIGNAIDALCPAEKNVALAGENSSEWLAAFLAVTASGRVAVCVDIEQPAEEICQCLDQADAELILCSTAILPLCAESGRRVCCWDELASESDASKIIVPETLTPDSAAAIIFTSGTTAQPRPVLLSHRNILHNAYAGCSSIDLGARIYSVLPFYHSYGLTCAVIAALISGAQLCVSGDMRTMLRDIALSQAQTMISVPLMAEAMHNLLWNEAEKEGCADIARRRSKSRISFGHSWRDKLMCIKQRCCGDLRLMIVGGAHLDAAIADGLSVFDVTVLCGYGVSECSPLVAVNRPDDNDYSSVGHVLPCCEVKIDNDEIMVRGDNVMLGYYREPELTAEVMQNGWFKTGDLGNMDSHGLLHITGRSKNLIVLKNGKKISPEKLETLLRRNKLVKEVMAYGSTSGRSTDDVKPAVSIYPDPEQTVGMTSYEILSELQREVDAINATLPLYQQIQLLNIRDKSFARTSLQKLIR